MKNNFHVRDALEIAGVASVVLGLFLVAYEIRQANHIARAQAIMDLASGYNQINLAGITDTEFARLRLVMSNPESYEITPIEQSKITAFAYHVHNIMWSAQSAHDSGLLSAEDLATYRNELSQILAEQPAVAPILLTIYETQDWKRDAYVFEPLAKLAEIGSAESE